MQQGRLYPKHQIEALERQLKELQLQARALQQQHESLQLQHAIAASCCEILDSLRSCNLHRDWLRAKGGILLEELPLLLDLGFQVDLSQLLGERQQLDQQEQQQQLPPVRVTRAKAATAATPFTNRDGRKAARSRMFNWEPDCEPLAATDTAAGAEEPAQNGLAGRSAKHGFAGYSRVYLCPGDFQGLLKYTLSQPPYPGAETMTIDDLADHFEAAVKETTFTLNLLEQCKERGDDVCTDVNQLFMKLRDLLLNHSRMIISVLLLNPDDLPHKFRVINMETRELSDTPEQAHKRHCWLVDKLLLTDKQRQAITAGGHLFSRLLDRIRADRRQLLAQQQAQTSERLLTGRAADLQAQQDAADRLHILLQKERLLLTMASTLLGSVLDVLQLSNAFVITWPWPPHLGMLTGILAARDNEDQQPKQQQQQQQQQRQQTQEEAQKQPHKQQEHWRQQDRQQQQQQQQHALLPPMLPLQQHTQQQQQQPLLQQHAANWGKRPGSAVSSTTAVSDVAAAVATTAAASTTAAAAAGGGGGVWPFAPSTATIAAPAATVSQPGAGQAVYTLTQLHGGWQR